MKVAKIKIENVLGIEHLEINPGSVTQLLGANGSGKTSVLESIKAVLSGGHDATLLRQGAESGEIVLVLEDGVEIAKKIGAEKSSVSVKHPQFGPIKKTAEYIKKITDALSVNPVKFLTADAEERLDVLLKSIPMTVTADQLGFVPTMALAGVDLDQHALPVLAKISKAVYDLRTGVNRAAKEKRITAEQMTAALPAEAPEGDWGDTLNRANAEYRDTLAEARKRVEAIKADASAAIEAHKNLFAAKRESLRGELEAEVVKRRKALDDEIAKLQRAYESGVARITSDAEIEVKRCEHDRDGQIESVNRNREQALKAAEDEYQPRLKALNESIGNAKIMLEAHTKAEAAREFIASLSEDAHKLETQGMELTGSLESIEELKASLLEKLPVIGLTVQDGDIYVDGIPFDRVNESKRIRLAIEISKLRAGSLGLVAVDGLECLDPKTFAAFKREASKSGLQFVISRVTDDEALTIETDREVVA
jgi:energy-coupling factor transporter ATP-binding protein EcfA2